MSLFAEKHIQGLCARLLDSQNEKGCSFDSKHGRELLIRLQAVDGIRPVGRSARHVLTEAGRDYLVRQLAQVVSVAPDKREHLQTLGVTLPSCLNQASFHALWHGDSKYPRSDNSASQLPINMVLTQDEVLRLRTLDQIVFVDLVGLRHDMTESMRLLGELALPERALATLAAVDWQGTQVITVENKGAFVDYPLQRGQLLLFSPGRNTSLAKRCIPLLPDSVQWAHFGDLDQRGIDIAVELARDLNRPVMLWLPCQLTLFLQHYARPVCDLLTGDDKVPWRSSDFAVAASEADKVGTGWLNELRQQDKWLEQEVLIVASHWRAWLLVRGE
ncbi:Wadjet anti-phage system protein JetD domain-containing protein [Aeromonas enteropelogenes]|uniref:Wadjet anti-phage system protein JetD domain-containing protein n=1 Tax=Aeromonas enteropelogenes TaxID=29489 RepID=UPI003BA1EB23